MGIYQLAGLVCCVWLVVQSSVRPHLAAAGFALGFGILSLLLGAHWLQSVVGTLVSFGLTYVYLSGLDLLSGVKFWACFACGILVIFLTNLAIRQVPLFLGTDG